MAGGGAVVSVEAFDFLRILIWGGYVKLWGKNCPFQRNFGACTCATPPCSWKTAYGKESNHRAPVAEGFAPSTFLNTEQAQYFTLGSWPVLYPQRIPFSIRKWMARVLFMSELIQQSWKSNLWGVSLLWFGAFSGVCLVSHAVIGFPSFMLLYMDWFIVHRCLLIY